MPRKGKSVEAGGCWKLGMGMGTGCKWPKDSPWRDKNVRKLNCSDGCATRKVIKNHCDVGLQEMVVWYVKPTSIKLSFKKLVGPHWVSRTVQNKAPGLKDTGHGSVTRRTAPAASAICMWRLLSMCGSPSSHHDLWCEARGWSRGEGGVWQQQCHVFTPPVSWRTSFSSSFSSHTNSMPIAYWTSHTTLWSPAQTPPPPWPGHPHRIWLLLRSLGIPWRESGILFSHWILQCAWGLWPHFKDEKTKGFIRFDMGSGPQCVSGRDRSWTLVWTRVKTNTLEHLLSADSGLSTVHTLMSPFLLATLRRGLFYSHFTNEKTEELNGRLSSWSPEKQSSSLDPQTLFVQRSGHIFSYCFSLNVTIVKAEREISRSKAKDPEESHQIYWGLSWE